jgi:hypothetical protein
MWMRNNTVSHRKEFGSALSGGEPQDLVSAKSRTAELAGAGKYTAHGE